MFFKQWNLKGAPDIKMFWDVDQDRTETLPQTMKKNCSVVVFSCQSGKLQIFELASGSLLETVDAHDGALWSLCLAPDQVNLTAALSVFTPVSLFLHCISPSTCMCAPVEGDCHRKCR